MSVPMKPFWALIDNATGEKGMNCYDESILHSHTSHLVTAGTHRIARCVEDGAQGERREIADFAFRLAALFDGLTEAKGNTRVSAYVDAGRMANMIRAAIPQPEPAQPATSNPMWDDLIALKVENIKQRDLPQAKEDIDGCMKASAWLDRKLDALIQKHAATPEPAPASGDLVQELRDALSAERVWHEDQRKAMSKQPKVDGWLFAEHQERIDEIDAILAKGVK